MLRARLAEALAQQAHKEEDPTVPPLPPPACKERVRSGVGDAVGFCMIFGHMVLRVGIVNTRVTKYSRVCGVIEVGGRLGHV